MKHKLEMSKDLGFVLPKIRNKIVFAAFYFLSLSVSLSLSQTLSLYLSLSLPNFDSITHSSMEVSIGREEHFGLFFSESLFLSFLSLSLTHTHFKGLSLPLPHIHLVSSSVSHAVSSLSLILTPVDLSSHTFEHTSSHSYVADVGGNLRTNTFLTLSQALTPSLTYPQQMQAAI